MTTHNLWSNTLLIGISGKKGHGKDLMAGSMQDFVEKNGLNYNILRRAFGDALKEEVTDFLVTRLWSQHRTECHPALLGLTKQKAWIVIRGWLDDREHKEDFRKLMQWWGTEYRRQMTRDSYWLDRVEEFIIGLNNARPSERHIILVPDVRFPNESKWIHSHGGVLIRVERPDAPITGDENHPSETALDDWREWDYEYQNKTISATQNFSTDLLQSLMEWKWSRRQ